MAEKFEFLTLEGLSEYKTLNDAKVQQAIDQAVADSIKTVSVSDDGYTLYFYTKREPVEEREAKYSISFPSPVNIDGKADKVKNATSGNFAGLDSNGNLTDSGKKADDFEVAGASDSVRTELLTLIGTIPPTAVSKTIVNYINEQVEAGKYDDTALKKLANDNKIAIDILNGTGDGSVTKTVADALTEFVEGAPESLDTYKELTDWIMNHQSDALSMNSQINTNKQDIASLKALIGTLPDDIKSTTVIDYIAEYVSGVIGDFNLEDIANDVTQNTQDIETLTSELNSTKDRVSALETKTQELDNKIGTIPSDSSATNIVDYVKEVLQGIAPDVSALMDRMSAIESRVSVNEGKITTNTSDIANLKDLVGDGYEAIPLEDIQALFK